MRKSLRWLAAEFKRRTVVVEGKVQTAKSHKIQPCESHVPPRVMASAGRQAPTLDGHQPRRPVTALTAPASLLLFTTMSPLLPHEHLQAFGGQKRRPRRRIRPGSYIPIRSGIDVARSPSSIPAPSLQRAYVLKSPILHDLPFRGGSAQL